MVKKNEKCFLDDTKIRHDIKSNLNSIAGFAELIKDGAFGELDNSRYLEYINYIYDSSIRINHIVTNYQQEKLFQTDALKDKQKLSEAFVNEKEFIKSLNSKGCFIEKNNRKILKDDYSVISKNNDAVFVAVSTKTAYKVDLVDILTNIVKTKTKIDEDKTDNFKQVLAEVIPNAIIHGNLNIDSLKANDALAFHNHNLKIRKRLDNPKYSKKLIIVKIFWSKTFLLCSVLDEGNGHNKNIEAPLVTASSGRGLFLISSMSDAVWFKNGGREINFGYFLNQKNKEVFNYKKEKDYLKNLTLMPDLYKSRILIVDDDQNTCQLIKEILQKEGFKNTFEANCGLECIKLAIVDKPDLIILDIDMKPINGFEVLAHIKSIDGLKNIPILIQTGFGSKNVIETAFKEGATDYISKPINNKELLSRIKVHLQNRVLIKTLGNKLNTIETDIGVASRMQQELIPKKDKITKIQEQMSFKIFNHFEPSAFLGGDLWDIVPVSKNKFAIYLVDFSGHGVSGSLNTFRLKSILSQINLKKSKPSAVLNHINKALAEQLSIGNFATFIYALFDKEKATMTYSSAGSPPAFVGIKQDDNLDLKFFADKELPLGIRKKHTYKDHKINFPKGSFWLAYSDALYESKTINDGFIENNDFYQTFNNNDDIFVAVTELKDKLAKPIVDDLTIVMAQHI